MRDDAAVRGAPLAYSAEEMMVVAAARTLRNRSRCFVGIGLPGVACNLARATHAPDIVLVYESGTIGARPTRLPLSIGDGELAETAALVVSLPEVFNYWLQGGHIDVGFLGAAQIDRFGNLNTTVIGDYAHPAVRLPGAGGAPEIAASALEVLVMATHSRRVFVRQLDFLTSAGSPVGSARTRRNLGGRGVSTVVTDLGILRLADHADELCLTAVHDGVTVADVVAATDWPLRLSSSIEVEPAPTTAELAALRELVPLLKHHEPRVH